MLLVLLFPAENEEKSMPQVAPLKLNAWTTRGIFPFSLKDLTRANHRGGRVAAGSFIFFSFFPVHFVELVVGA